MCVYSLRYELRRGGRPSLAIQVLIKPIDPIEPWAGPTFVQAAATVEVDGTWSTLAQLGSSESPAATGDPMEVAAMIVNGGSEGPPDCPPSAATAITVDEIPCLVAVTGILDATVEVSR